MTAELLDRAGKATLQEALKIGIRVGAIDWFAKGVLKRLPNLVRVQGLTPEFISRFQDLTGRNMVPLGVAGHFSHLDHVVVSDLCYKLISLAGNAGLGDNLHGFVETLAKSNPDGRQSKFIQGVYSRMEVYAKDNYLKFIPITRAKDAERYGMPQGISDKRPLIAALRQKGVGALISPGGSIQPGRHPKGASRDSINGLQEIKDTDVLDMFYLMERLGKRIGQEPYFLPIAIDGTYRLYSSDSLLPTPEGVISFYRIPSRILGLFGFKRMMVTITPGMPLTAEDMVNRLGVDWRNHPKEAIDFLMIEVARKLPPNARGYYGKFVQD